ncbi:hypothetical protein B566_EDAN007565 [Ephemera danica]|nr:hypothetical protein B566_EDAN007565 [Ephemera danica]
MTWKEISYIFIFILSTCVYLLVLTMGIRGLTTFISNNSRTYLSSHKLHDCTIVIDGNNLASQLYVWFSKSNSAFGGDYDRYYKCVRNFFLRLKECNITALVVFDGGYETRKLGTVWARLRNKFLVCKKVNPKNQVRKNMFPLLMKEQFRDILIELGISFAQCDFEADEEIAALARELKCPVLSYDSDFFVHDVLYIPFNSLEMSVTKGKNSKTGQSFSYINCDIYNVDRFLATFGGMLKDMLPLMATVLGNDYIKASLFDGFFSQIRLPKRNREYTYQHRKIAGLLQWLRKENVESAVPKILSHLKQKDRKYIEKQMQRAIVAYACNSSKIRKYLEIPGKRKCVENEPSGSTITEQAACPDVMETLNDPEELEKEEDEGEDDSGSNAEEELEIENVAVADNLADLEIEDVDDETPENIPEWFLQLFREGLLPACLMDLLTNNRFYILHPQKEDYSVMQSSHDLSVPLIRYLITILLGQEDASKIRVITRRNCSPCYKKLFNDDIHPESDLPSLQELPQLPHSERLKLLMRPTGMTQSLATIPEEWQLLFLAIAYWASHAKYPPVSEKHVHAIILALILLAVVQPGRKGKKNRAVELSKTCQRPQGDAPNIQTALQEVQSTEYAEIYSTIYVPHSHAEGKNQKVAYDLSIVHSFAQLQSVMLVLTQLNQILGMPLKHIPFHQVLSGTLLYNLQRALLPRNDINAYLSSCLSKSPTVLALHQSLTNTVLQHLAPSTPRSVMIPRKPRKKRTRNELSDSSSKEEDSKKRNKDEKDTEMAEDIVASSGLLPLRLLRGLDSLRSQKELCDIVLRSGNGRFYAHRVVLAAVSPFFRTICSSSFEDSKKKEIEIKEADEETLAAVVDYIYTGKIKDDTDVVSVLQLAEFLQMGPLRCICAEYLKQNINVLNCEHICKIAETLELQHLYEAAKKFSTSLHHEPDADKHYEQANMFCIPAVVFVAGGRDYQGMCLRTAECLTKVNGSYRWRHSRPPKPGEVEEPSDTIAVMHETRAEAAFVATHTHLYVIGGKTNANTFMSSMECYSLADNKWQQLAPLPVELSDAAATLAQGRRIFVIGGRNSKDWECRVWIYHIETDSWHQGPALPEKRIQHAAVTWHNAIYVLGGKTEQEAGATSSVLVLEPGATDWFLVSSMQRPRCLFACTSAHGCIYVVGGTDGIHTLARAEKYDLMKDKWSTVASYSLPIEGSCAATLVSHPEQRKIRFHQNPVESIICVGGSDGSDATNRAERLGVSGEHWHCLPELNTPRSRCAGAVLLVPHL